MTHKLVLAVLFFALGSVYAEDAGGPAFTPQNDLSRSLGRVEKKWNGVYTPFISDGHKVIEVKEIATTAAVIEALADKATLDSPAFVGEPTAPTPEPDDDSDRLATTEYVNYVMSGFIRGDDYRLEDDRKPLRHASTHAQDGTDPIPLPVAANTVLGITRGDGTTIRNNPDGTLSTIQGSYTGMPIAPNDGKIYGATGAEWVESAGEGNVDHAKLTPSSRNLPDQHPISAITGLEDALSRKAASSHAHVATDITSGTLPIARGGTGNATGLAASATKLATPRTVRTNLASATTASFDGSANIAPGVTGVLPVANGGTGASTAAAARTALGIPAATVSVKGTRTTTGTWTISGLTANKPLHLIYSPVASSTAGCVDYSVTSGIVDAPRSMALRLGYYSAHSYTKLSDTIVPTSTSVVLNIASLTAGTLRAYQ